MGTRLFAIQTIAVRVQCNLGTQGRTQRVKQMVCRRERLLATVIQIVQYEWRQGCGATG